MNTSWPYGVMSARRVHDPVGLIGDERYSNDIAVTFLLALSLKKHAESDHRSVPMAYPEMSSAHALMP